MSGFRTVPEICQPVKGQVKIPSFSGKTDEQKGDAALFFKILHEQNLMFVNILDWKGPGTTFFGIKAHRHALDSTDIVHSTPLVEISQCNMPRRLINLNRLTRRRYFLNQRQLFLPVFFICQINEFLQFLTPETSGIPSCHYCFSIIFLLTISAFF